MNFEGAPITSQPRPEATVPTLRSLLGRKDEINVDKAVEFVLSCMNFDGGFGCAPGAESHGGPLPLPEIAQYTKST